MLGGAISQALGSYHSYPVFTKSELVLDDGAVTVDLPDEIVRGLGEAVRDLLEGGGIGDARYLDRRLGDSQGIRSPAQVEAVIRRPDVPYH